MHSANPPADHTPEAIANINDKTFEMAVEIRKTHRGEIITRRRTHNAVLLQHPPTDNKQETQSEVSQIPKKTFKRSEVMKRFNEAVMDMHSNDTDRMIQGVISLKKLTCHPDYPPIQEILDSGIVPMIMHLALQEDNEAMKTEAGWILLNMCYGTAEQGLLGILVKFIQSNNINLIENAIWSFGNVTADESLAKIVVDSPLIEEIIKVVFKVPSPTLLEKASWCFSNICRTKVKLSEERVKQITPILMKTLEIPSSDENLFYEILWGLSNISSVKSCHRILMENDNLSKLLSFLVEPNATTSITATLILLSNLCCNKQQAESIFREGMYFTLLNLLSHQKQRIKKETVALLKNGCQQSDKIALAIANDQKIMQKLMPMSERQPDPLVKELMLLFKQMALALPLDVVVKVFSVYEVMRSMTIVLVKNNSLLGRVVLQVVGRLLDLCEPKAPNALLEMFNRNGGCQLLERLQEHGSDDIYRLCLDILQKHYDLQDSVF